jgi:hypothetical protein
LWWEWSQTASQSQIPTMSECSTSSGSIRRARSSSRTSPGKQSPSREGDSSIIPANKLPSTSPVGRQSKRRRSLTVPPLLRRRDDRRLGSQPRFQSRASRRRCSLSDVDVRTRKDVFYKHRRGPSVIAAPEKKFPRWWGRPWNPGYSGETIAR